MRIGINPAKEKNTINKAAFYHRIIIPVYIPNLEGYYKDGLKILELCLTSVCNTKNDLAVLTVVDNNSCKEVKDFLNKLHEEKKIELLISNNENQGKVEAIMQAVRSTHEPLITVSDCDVLFLRGWQYNVEKVFTDFKHAGFVSPAPSPLSFSSGTASVFFNELIRGKIGFREIEDKKGVMDLANSIEQSDLLNENHRKYFVCLNNGENKFAVLGAGHFVATINRKVFSYAPIEKCVYKILGDSERKYIDEPVENSGLYKLSTTKVYALHLGNTLEDWMQTKLDTENNQIVIDSETLINNLANAEKPFLNKMFPYFFRNVFFRVILNRKYFRSYLYRILGMRFTSKEY